MFPSFIILFREVLEIAIILSIIMAATRGVPARGRYVWLGIAGGLAGSVAVAFSMRGITEAMEGMGQEVFNGTVMLIASAMIAWTTIWMQTHGREISQRMKQVGAAVRDGSQSLYALTVVVALSMWREGAEVSLFMTGIILSGKETLASIMLGATGGALAAAVVGVCIYLGLIKISSKYLFTVTGWMLILLACGMAASGANFLAAADVVPALAYDVWDSSGILSESSAVGTVLGAMFGYSERPTGIQLVFYIGMLVTILTLLRLRKPAVAKVTA